MNIKGTYELNYRAPMAFIPARKTKDGYIFQKYTPPIQTPPGFELEETRGNDGNRDLIQFLI